MNYVQLDNISCPFFNVNTHPYYIFSAILDSDRSITAFIKYFRIKTNNVA